MYTVQQEEEEEDTRKNKETKNEQEEFGDLTKYKRIFLFLLLKRTKQKQVFSFLHDVYRMKRLGCHGQQIRGQMRTR